MIDFLQEYGMQILVATAGGMTLLVANRARSFLKHLTVDKVVDYTEKLIERYTKDDKSRDKLNTIVGVVSNLPIIKSWFDKTQTSALDFVEAKIHELEAKIIDYQIKLDNGVISDELRKVVMENIEQLKKDKAKLVALYESQQTK